MPLAINTSYVCCACRYTNTMSHVFVPIGIGRRLERGHLQSQVRLRAESQKPRQFLRQVYYWLTNFRILCNTKYPDNMQSVWMNWKVSGQSKKCPDNLENVSG